MKKRLSFLIWYFLFWVLYFITTKGLFLAYHHQKTAQLSLLEVLGVLGHGLRLDLSFAGYIAVLPFILISFSGFLSNQLVRSLIVGFTTLLLVFTSLLTVTDLELYLAWGYRLDATPLMYINTPQEMLASMEMAPWVKLILIMAGLVLSSVYLFVHFLSPDVLKWEKKQAVATLLMGLLLTTALIIPIRGGFQLAPLNQSSVYFSTHPYANHAAVNVVWNFFSSVVNKTYLKENPYTYFSPEVAQQQVDALYQQHPENASLLNNSKPNILLIIWESGTAKVMEPLGGRKGVTPEFTRLTKQGILFDHLYASGDRSDKGIVAILSGFPAQPTTSIMTVPTKTAKLPILSLDLKKAGYSTAFYYGGEPEFANIKSYLLSGGFDQIVGKDDFDKKDMNSKWGAHDHVVFNRMLTDLSTAKKPFFKTLFTLSSHEPFEVPAETVFPGEDAESKFINALHYTDKSLGDFIDHAQKQAWWQNTLVIIIADHGHPMPASDDKMDDFHIPMLWLGGVLTKKDTVITKVSSQIDLSATLLSQLHLNHEAYTWSKNILSSQTQPFAYFAFNDGFGFVQPNKELVFDNIGKSVIQQHGDVQSKDVDKGKAYVQASFQDYLNK